MRTLTYAGVDFAEFKCWWDGSQVFRKPNKIVNRYQIPYRNGDLIRSTEAFENVEISFNCFIKEDYEENYSNLVNYLNSFDSYQRLETSAEPSIYRMALLHAVIEPETGQFLKDGRFTLTFDCMPQEWLKSGENEMSIDMQTTTYTDPVEVDIEYDDALVDNAVLTLSPVQDLNGQEYPWVDKVGRNKLNLVNMAKTETVNGITFTLTDEGKIYMNGTQDGSTTVTMWFPFASIETIPYGTYKISGLPSNMTFGDYGFSTIDSDQHITEHYENNSEVTDTIINFGVWVYEGVTLNNVELKPMIRESTDTSDVWQPYEHTTNICPIYPSNGKNLLDESTIEVGSYTSTGTTISNGNLAYRRFSLNLKAGTYVFSTNLPNATTIRILANDVVLSDSAGNPPKTFTLDADSTVKVAFRNTSTTEITESFNCQVELGSTATAYVPYQSVVVQQTGKNLLPTNTYTGGTRTTLRQTLAVELTNILKGKQGAFTISGVSAHTSTNSYLLTLIINYTDSTSDTTTMYRGESAGAIVGHWSATTDPNKIIDNINIGGNSASATCDLSEMMCEVGSEATTYEPYAGNTYTSDLEQFVYGGTVDLVTGVLTVNRILVDLDTLTTGWQTATVNGKAVLRRLVSEIKNADNRFYIKCSHFRYAGNTTAAVDDETVTNLTANYYNLTLCAPNLFTTQAELNAWTASQKASGTPVQLSYLVDPTTVQLTPQEIELLTGKNYFTAEQPLSVTITEGTTLTNPSYMKARPIIKLNNAGTGTVKLNGDVVVRVTEAPSNVPIYIDCENMNCYSYDEDGNVVNENGNVTLPEGYIEMEKGNNRFTATGQLEPTMIPRWWRL